jgi:protocatechuate 3,4-dioxygenase alpha subunit
MTDIHLPRTPSQTVGPYLHIGLGGTFKAALVEVAGAGAIRLHGRVLDGAGDPVPDALVELWQADTEGRYGDPGFGGFARSDTRAGGRFEFVVVKPGRVRFPGGGFQAPHLELGVFARGLLKRVVTRMYFPDEVEANVADPVLSGIDTRDCETLIAAPEPDGSLRFDIHLQGDRQTVFFAL